MLPTNLLAKKHQIQHRRIVDHDEDEEEEEKMDLEEEDQTAVEGEHGKLCLFQK